MEILILRPFSFYICAILLLCLEGIQSEEINNGNPECDGYLAEEIQGLHARITLLEAENSQLKNKNRFWLQEHHLHQECQNELNWLRTSYTVNNNWDTELHFAVNRRELGTVKGLLDSGAYINTRNRLMETPLIRAGQTTDLIMTKYLIENGADIYAKDVGNRTFLHNLVADETTLTPTEFHEISEYLIGKNMSKLFNMPGWTGVNTAIMMAVKNIVVQPATLELLSNGGVDLNEVSTEGDSIFVYALLGRRDKTVLEELVKLGVNWRTLDQFKRNLVHAAAAYCYPDGLRFLLELGLDKSLQDNWNDTPLHLAVLFGRERLLETVRLLVEKGADPKIRNKRGKTPLEEALLREDMSDKDEVTKYLRGQ